MHRALCLHIPAYLVLAPAHDVCMHAHALGYACIRARASARLLLMQMHCHHMVDERSHSM